MGEALKDAPRTPFRIPPGLRLVRVNPATGQLAQPGDRPVIMEAFRPGTEPGADDARPTAGGMAPVGGGAAQPASTSGVGGGIY